ncbi:MAG: hypothetical protein LBF74_05675 [Treponema sp.]|nr:hypothetical protein [Treponema sp.]
MKITISRPIGGISINGDEYVLDEDGCALAFDSVEAAICYLADNGFTIGDLQKLNWHFEEEVEKT